jgi:hypothetical protein
LKTGKLILLLFTFTISCQQKENENLKELNKYLVYIEETSASNHKEIVEYINRCSGSSLFDSLKEVLEEVHHIKNESKKELENVNSLKQLEELAERKRIHFSEIQSYQKEARRVLDSQEKVQFSAFSLEEAKVVFLINTILIEARIRKEILNNWAIDCPI